MIYLKRLFYMWFVGVILTVFVSSTQALQKEVNEHFNRPVVKHNTALRYQPYQQPHRFLNMGSGFLIYSHNSDYRSAVPVMIAGCLKAYDEDIMGYDSSRNGAGRHSWKGYSLNDDSMQINLNFGPYSDDILKVENKEESLVIRQTTTFKKGCELRAIGFLFKFPVSLWKDGSWVINNQTGEFDNDTDISVKKAGNTFKFIQNNGVQVEIEFENNIREIKINKNERLFDNYEVYFITEGSLDSVPQIFSKKFASCCKLKFSGKLYDPVIAPERIEHFKGWNWQKYDGQKIFDWRFDDEWLDENLQYQMLDVNSEFYGMVTSGGKWTDVVSMQTVVLPTRDFLEKATSAYANPTSKYFNSNQLSHSIEAALDYVTASIDRQSGQIGEIRSKSWSVKPFAWGVTPYAKAIWIMKKNRLVDNDKIAYWLSCYEYLWKESSYETAMRGREENEVGWNQASKIITSAKGAEFLAIDNVLPQLRQGISECMAPNANPVWGIKSDFSHREHSPNFFDVRYLSNLHEDLCEWYAEYKNTDYGFKEEQLSNFENITESISWLYDNGVLTNITGDNRCRLCREPNYAFYLTKDDYKSAETIYNQIKSRQAGNDVAVDDNGLKKGFKWYYNPGLAVARTNHYYFAAVAKAGNITCSNNSWNYNAKVPVGGFYMRSAGMPREAAIPSDNVNFSGVTLIDGMDDYKDADNEFMNNKNSCKIDFIYNDDTAMFGMEGHISAMAKPEDILVFNKTYFMLDETVIAIQYIPSQEVKADCVVYPLVMSTSSDKTAITPEGKFCIKADNENASIMDLGSPARIELETMTLIPLKQPSELSLVDLGSTGYRLEGIGQWSDRKPTQMAKLQAKLDPSDAQSFMWAYLPKQGLSWEQLVDENKFKIVSSDDTHLVETANSILLAKYSSGLFSNDKLSIEGSAFVLVKESDNQIHIIVSPWEEVKFIFKNYRQVESVKVLRGLGDYQTEKNQITLTSSPNYHYYQKSEDLVPLDWRKKNFDVESYVDKQKIPFEIIVTFIQN